MITNVIRSTKTHIASILAFSLYALLHQPLLAAEPEQKISSSYEKLAQAYLPSLAQEAQKEKADELERHSHNAKVKEELLKKSRGKGIKLQSSDVEIPSVGEVEKLSLIYNLLHKQSTQQTPTLSNEVLSDLGLFYGESSDPKHHVFGTLDRTVTAFGKIELQRMLLEPQTNIAGLQARQEIVKHLIKNPKLASTIERYLQTIKASENEFLWFWKQTDETTDQFFNQVYFGKTLGINFSGLNKNATATNMGALWTLYGSPMWHSIGMPLALMAMIATGIKMGIYKVGYNPQTSIPQQYHEKIRNLAQNPNAFAQSIDNLMQENEFGFRFANQIAQGFDIPLEATIGKIKQIPPAVLQKGAQLVLSPSFINIYTTLLSLSYNMLLKKITSIPSGVASFYRNNQIGSEIKVFVGYYAFILALMFIFTYIVPLVQSINSARQFNDISNMIQTKMINAASYFDAVKQLTKLTSADPAFNKIRANLVAQNPTLQEQAELKELLRLLETSTMKGNASFFSFKGNALTAFKLMQSTKDDLIGALQFAGKIDAYLAIAKLMCSSPYGRYCFVNYQKSSTPYLKIDEFWHPMLNPTTVVTNDVELGASTGARNLIITGPNAGGKSTALKSITLAVIMAQTLGIAPAKAMTLTPFTQTGTYLNVADKVGKDSTYQAEMNRAGALLQSIRSLKPGEFSFVIMDEIFTGTNPREGSAGAFGIATRLASYPQSICLIATHYKQLTELEQTTNGVFKNRKVSVLIAPDGKITSTYTLGYGASDQQIALQLLENAGFDQEILQAAQDALKNQSSQQAA